MGFIQGFGALGFGITDPYFRQYRLSGLGRLIKGWGCVFFLGGGGGGGASRVLAFSGISRVPTKTFIDKPGRVCSAPARRARRARQVAAWVHGGVPRDPQRSEFFKCHIFSSCAARNRCRRGPQDVRLCVALWHIFLPAAAQTIAFKGNQNRVKVNYLAREKYLFHPGQTRS